MARGKQVTIEMRESLDAPAPEKGIRDFYIFLVSSQSQPYDPISVTTPVQPKVLFGAMSETKTELGPFSCSSPLAM